MAGGVRTTSPSLKGARAVPPPAVDRSAPAGDALAPAGGEPRPRPANLKIAVAKSASRVRTFWEEIFTAQSIARRKTERSKDSQDRSARLDALLQEAEELGRAVENVTRVAPSSSKAGAAGGGVVVDHDHGVDDHVGGRREDVVTTGVAGRVLLVPSLDEDGDVDMLGEQHAVVSGAQQFTQHLHEVVPAMSSLGAPAGEKMPASTGGKEAGVDELAEPGAVATDHPPPPKKERLLPAEGEEDSRPADPTTSVMEDVDGIMVDAAGEENPKPKLFPPAPPGPPPPLLPDSFPKITKEPDLLTSVPTLLLRGHLRQYQHVGMDWLARLHKNQVNGILADEMGLGKTIETIAVLCHLAVDQGIWGPHCVVVPTAVLYEIPLRSIASSQQIFLGTKSCHDHPPTYNLR